MLDRLEPRVKCVLPVKIAGTDAQGNRCQRLTCTLEISERGARITGVPDKLQPGMALQVTYKNRCRTFRVAWVGQAGTRVEHQIGVLAEGKKTQFWPEWRKHKSRAHVDLVAEREARHRVQAARPQVAVRANPSASNAQKATERLKAATQELLEISKLIERGEVDPVALQEFRKALGYVRTSWMQQWIFALLRFVNETPEEGGARRAAVGVPEGFDAESFLATTGVGGTLMNVEKNQLLFTQGDSADEIFYIRKGKVKLSVVSGHGKEAIIAQLGEGEFVGESCIAVAQPSRHMTATAITDCALVRITRKDLVRVIHEQPADSDVFVSFLLARNARIQADLVDQLFNASEKRLARILLLLAQFGKEGKPDKVIAKISPETLAQMIGSTRSRVSYFMNRFRKLGFINYNDAMEVHSSLLNVILHD